MSFLEHTTNLSTDRGPGRDLQSGGRARILSGPHANQDVRVVALEAPDVARVELCEANPHNDPLELGKSKPRR